MHSDTVEDELRSGDAAHLVEQPAAAQEAVDAAQTRLPEEQVQKAAAAEEATTAVQESNLVEMPAQQAEAEAEAAGDGGAPNDPPNPPATLEQPEPDASEPSKPVALPVCPYCGEDPAKLSVMPQAFPGGLIGTISFCGNPDCRKIHSVQILGQAQKTPSGIIVPPGASR